MGRVRRHGSINFAAARTANCSTGCAAGGACEKGAPTAAPPLTGYHPMRICIFGAGAVGSHFAVRLALAGHDVCCVMRGPHLEAVKAKGLTLRVGEAGFSARGKSSDDAATLGPQDLVISTLKANSLGSLVRGLPPLLGDNTGIVFAQNGIPWWYDIGLPPDHRPPPDLAFLDPGGRLRAVGSRERIVGGVIFSSNEVVEPGVVKNLSADRNRLLSVECDDRT